MDTQQLMILVVCHDTFSASCRATVSETSQCVDGKVCRTLTYSANMSSNGSLPPMTNREASTGRGSSFRRALCITHRHVSERAHAAVAINPAVSPAVPPPPPLLAFN